MTDVLGVHFLSRHSVHDCLLLPSVQPKMGQDGHGHIFSSGITKLPHGILTNYKLTIKLTIWATITGTEWKPKRLVVAD